MNRILIILTLCLLTSLLGYSQANYPIKLKLGKDTVIAITVDQLRVTNIKFAHLNFLEDQNILLSKRVCETLQLSLSKDSLIDQKNIVISGLKDLNNDAVLDIAKANKAISDLTTERDKYKKKSKMFWSTTIGLVVLLTLSLL